MTPDRLSVTLRALYLVALYQAAGAAFFLLLMHGRLGPSAAAIRRLAFASAVIGVVLAGLHQTLEAARMADEFGRWPWPRDTLATVLDYIERQKPQAVAASVTERAFFRASRACFRRTAFT